MKKRIQQILSFVIAGGLCYAAFIGPLHANPQGGLVIEGNATIQADASSLIVTQNTDKAIINWQQFNIASGEKTVFLQPNSNSLILNRVIGGDPSQIFGQISANGRVVLVNPAGIYMGNTARINVNSLIATTANISDANFMAGNLQFSQDPAIAKSIINEGEIHAAAEGLVALVAPAVANNGIIQANLGKVALAAGNAFTVDLYGDQLVNFAVNSQVTKTATDQNGAAMTSAVSNKGKIIADGGKVLMTANVAQHVVQNVINLEGVAQARSVSNRNGEIILSGGDNGVVRVAGELDVSGKAAGQKGGTIKVLGQNVKLEGAKLDASGDIGGGKILVGGNYQGGGTEQRAMTTSVDANSLLDASAITQGNGGQVVVWSDQHTQYAGHIAARGGALWGNGGMAEVSGKDRLDFRGTVDMSAANGKVGQLLLDPSDITISDEMDIEGSVFNIDVLVAALTTADVTIQTDANVSGLGNISVNNGFTWHSGNSLTLKAHNDINLSSGITITNTGGANINLIAGTSGSGLGTITGDGKISTSGQVNFYYNPSSYPTPTDYSANVELGTNLTAYMLVNNVTQLQMMNDNLSGNYALSKDIDASATAEAAWDDGSGAGFAPIGTLFTPFTGSFDGLNYKINGLYINRPDTDYVGLFGYANGTAGINTISNVSLTNVDITARRIVGALVGRNFNTTINNASSSGTITAGSGTLGGLVGSNNNSTISNSYSSVNLILNPAPESSVRDVGGLVGQNFGSIHNSYATGNINASLNGQFIGGLVGYASYNAVPGDSSITNSYSTGNIIGGSNRVGGFIGLTGAITINNSFSSGAVQATDGAQNVGGFIGENSNAAISNAYSTGNVLANNGSNVGGFVGINLNNATIDNSYSWGLVSAATGTNVGGLVGANATGDSVTDSYWNTETSGQSSSAGGLGLSTAQMMNPDSYTGWNFGSSGAYNVSNPWIMAGTPHLYIENTATITNAVQLQLMAVNLGGAYTLANDIDLSATSGWNNGLGFMPIGDLSNAFTGSFEGNNFTLSNLNINRIAADGVGLFGRNSGSLQNLNLSNGLITGNYYVGMLVGYNTGVVSNITTSGSLSGVQRTGGIIGYSSGANLTNLHNSAAVTGSGNYVGGLVGENLGNLSNSSNTGLITGTGYYTGGLIGENSGLIADSYNSGHVVSNNFFAGGITGLNFGIINTSYNSGNISGHVRVGGLAGYSGGAGAGISDSYNLGNVTGFNQIGGLVGDNRTSIANAFSIGTVTSSLNDKGALVGVNVGGGLSNTYWNTQTSGVTSACGPYSSCTVSPNQATGLTTAQMMQQGSYNGWNFSDTWGIIENGSLPYLKAFHATAPQVISGTAYTDTSANTTVGTNVSIGLAHAGTEIATTTTHNGFYYFLLPGSTIAAQAPILTYLNSGSLLGNSMALFADSGTASITNHGIYGNAVTARNYSSANLSSSQLGAPIAGSPSFVGRLLYSLSGNDINVGGSGVTFQTAGNTAGAAVAGSGASFNLLGNLTSSGNINFNGALQLGGTGTQTLSTAANINLAGNTTGAGKNLALNARNITLAQVGLSGSALNSLNTTATESLTFNGALNAMTSTGSTPILNINSTAIDINNAIRDFVDSGATINLAGGNYNQNVLINEAINLVSLGTASLTSLSNTVDMGLSGSFIADTFNIDAPITLLGTTDLTATAGNININNLIDGYQTLTLTTSGLDATVINAAIGSITPLAALTINGNLIMNTGAAVNTVGSQLYNGALTLGGHVNLYSSNGNLTFNSTIQGPYDLTLGAPNGNITFNGAVGNLANRLGNLWITAANNVTALDALNVNSFIQSTGSGTTTFAGAGVNAAQNVLISTGVINGSITANNAAVLIGRNGINAQIDVGALTVGGLAGGTLSGKVANFEGAQAAFISRLATESQGIFTVNGVSLNLYNPEIDIRKLFGSYIDPTNDDGSTDYPAIMDIETTQDVNDETKIHVEGDATLHLAAKALCQ